MDNEPFSSLLWGASPENKKIINIEGELRNDRLEVRKLKTPSDELR